MLVLTRKTKSKENRILIGQGPEQIVVTIVDVRGKSVRVGIEAPAHIVIMREELIPNPPKTS